MPANHSIRCAQTIPAWAGIGLRAQHYQEVVTAWPATAWFEVHSENYFGDGGAPLRYLEQVRDRYPISLHGVGLSLGSTDALNLVHLTRLKSLVRRFEPGLVSEHLCWSSIDRQYLNDLLPLPYTRESLLHVSRRIEQVQEFLGRRILIENVSSYLEFHQSDIPEWEFITGVAQRSGCGILLDVNNIHVSATNHGFDPLRYLDAIPPTAVEEVHLAGFAVNHYDDGEILIDNHGAPVAEPVWQLYRAAIDRFGPTPTLIEWDTDIPAFHVLQEEARKADSILAQRQTHVA